LKAIHKQTSLYLDWTMIRLDIIVCAVLYPILANDTIGKTNIAKNKLKIFNYNICFGDKFY